MLILLIILTSCSNYRVASLPKLNIAGPGLNQSTFNLSDYMLVDKDVVSEDSYPIIIFFPIVGENQGLTEGMISNAIDRVCKEKKINFMTNVKVYSRSWYIPFIYGKVYIIIEGEGWSDKKTTSNYNNNAWGNQINNIYTTNWEAR